VLGARRDKDRSRLCRSEHRLATGSLAGKEPEIESLELLIGALVVAAVLYDVFQSIVVPRWTDRTLRLSPFLIDVLWPVWRRIGLRLRPAQRSENFLGTFAPLALIDVLLVWVTALIVGYGLMIHALREQIEPPISHLGTAFYLAGSSLLTLGFGDLVARGGPARFVLLAAAASGLAVVALVISLTFSLYGLFQRREVLVLTLDARAGAPPSGVTMLETYARLEILEELPATFAAWEVWSAEMLESHLAYPILPYFRSSHKNESWVSALGAVLDAATLLLTTLEGGHPAERSEERGPASRLAGLERPQGAAHLMYRLGCHALLDLSQWFRFRLPDEPEPVGEPTRAGGVERAEFVAARERLAAAGYRLCEEEGAWRSFVKHRSVYAAALNDLARHFATPPTQWIGDRSTATDPRHREAPAAAP
jgi:Ion channel